MDKLRIKNKRKEHIRSIQWCLNVGYNALAGCQMGFISDPLAQSVYVGKVKDRPSLSILPYLGE